MSGLKKQVGIFFIFSYNFPFEERIFITSSFTPIIFSKLSETTTCKVFLWIVALPKLYLKKKLYKQNFNQCWIYFVPNFTSQLQTFKFTKKEMKTIKLFRFSNPRLRKHLCEEFLKNRWCENGKKSFKYLY